MWGRSPHPKTQYPQCFTQNIQYQQSKLRKGNELHKYRDKYPIRVSLSLKSLNWGSVQKQTNKKKKKNYEYIYIQ